MVHPETELRHVSGTTIDIRDGSPADAEAISRVAAAVQSVHVQAHPRIFKPASPNCFAADEIRRLMATPSRRIFVAVDGEELVGYAYVEIQHLPETAVKYDAVQLYLHQMGVLPTSRSRGIGSELIRAVRRFAADQGISRMALDVWQFNSRARSFYEANGFRVHQVKMSAALQSVAPPSQPMPPDNDSASTLIAEMQAYYGSRAPVYNASMGYDKPDVIESLQPIIEALCNEMRDRTVLEIACGPGFWTQRIAAAARSVLATDYNESTLIVARANPAAPTNATFVQANAYDLSSIEGPFSGAFGVDWLAHVPKSRLQPFFAGLHRCLAPGARVAFCDQTPRETSHTGVYDAEGNHLQERELPDGSRHRVIKHFFSDDEFRQLLAPYSNDVSIRRFGAQRRVLVSYEWLQH